MAQPDTIYVAGHRGMVGSAIVRTLLAQGVRPEQIITRSHAELDLTDQRAVHDFFAQAKPAQVYLAAAKVGGIRANSVYRADFLYENLQIAANLIQGRNFRAFEAFIIATVIYLALSIGVRKLLNWLGPKYLFGR